MELKQFLDALSASPETVEFETVMAAIEANYEFTPAAFVNGETQNNAGENNGSCKIFAFGQLNNLSKEATLACFGRFYREDVLAHPENNDHQNIRNFMGTGWDGVKFETQALAQKEFAELTSISMRASPLCPMFDRLGDWLFLQTFTTQTKLSRFWLG